MLFEPAEKILDRRFIAKVDIGHLRQKDFLDDRCQTFECSGVPIQPHWRFTDAFEAAIGFEDDQQNVDTGFEMTSPANGPNIRYAQGMKVMPRQF